MKPVPHGEPYAEKLLYTLGVTRFVMGEIRCGKRRILSALALHKNSAFEIHTTKFIPL